MKQINQAWHFNGVWLLLSVNCHGRPTLIHAQIMHFLFPSVFCPKGNNPNLEVLSLPWWCIQTLNRGNLWLVKSPYLKEGVGKGGQQGVWVVGPQQTHTHTHTRMSKRKEIHTHFLRVVSVQINNILSFCESCLPSCWFALPNITTTSTTPPPIPKHTLSLIRVAAISSSPSLCACFFTLEVHSPHVAQEGNCIFIVLFVQVPKRHRVLTQHEPILFII